MAGLLAVYEEDSGPAADERLAGASPGFPIRPNRGLGGEADLSPQPTISQ
jgi:hypothetical protein